VKGAVHNTYLTPDGKFTISGSIEGKMLTVIDAQTLQIAWELPFDAGVVRLRWSGRRTDRPRACSCSCQVCMVSP
jgi:hypothetical protein